MIPLLFCGHTSAWILLLFHCIVIYYRDHRQNPKKKKGERQVENGSRTRSAGRSDRLYGVWGVTSHLPGYRAPIDRDFTSLWSTLRSFPLEVLQNPSHHPKNMSPLVCLSSSLRWLSISSPTFSTPCMYVYIDILHQE